MVQGLRSLRLAFGVLLKSGYDARMARRESGSMLDEQKKHELTVFEDVLSLARMHGGEGRRNAGRLKGIVDFSSERPDIVIDTDDGRLVGIEHFQVDQLIKNDKKVQSATAEFVNRAEADRKKVVGDADGELLDPTDEMIGMFGRYAAEYISRVRNSGIDDLTKSLKTRLFGGRGHAEKLDAYRSNVSTRKSGARVEMGYLIEFRSELSTLILNQGSSSRSIVSGELPLFSDLFDLIELAAKDVDWILFACYPALQNKIVEAAIARCSNGMLRKSLERQGLKRAECLGCVDRSPFVGQRCKGGFDYSVEGDVIRCFFQGYSDDVAIHRLVSESIKGAAKALKLSRNGKPFAATVAVQYCYELVRDRLKFRKNVTAFDVFETIRNMDKREFALRSSAFEERHSLSCSSTYATESGFL